MSLYEVNVPVRVLQPDPSRQQEPPLLLVHLSVVLQKVRAQQEGKQQLQQQTHLTGESS